MKFTTLLLALTLTFGSGFAMAQTPSGSSGTIDYRVRSSSRTEQLRECWRQLHDVAAVQHYAAVAD